MVTFHVQKISCGGCAAAITRAVKQADGNAEVDIDIATKKVNIQSSLPESDLAALMNLAGYPATPA